MDICNNDDCEINVNGIFDLALELTKIWGQTQKVSASWYDVWGAYRRFQIEIMNNEKGAEDEDNNEIEDKDNNRLFNNFSKFSI